MRLQNKGIKYVEHHVEDLLSSFCCSPLTHRVQISDSISHIYGCVLSRLAVMRNITQQGNPNKALSYKGCILRKGNEERMGLQYLRRVKPFAFTLQAFMRMPDIVWSPCC